MQVPLLFQLCSTMSPHTHFCWYRETFPGGHAGTPLVPVMLHDVSAHTLSLLAVQDSFHAVLCASTVEISGNLCSYWDLHVLLHIPGLGAVILQALTRFVLLAKVLLNTFSQSIPRVLITLCGKLH